MDKIQRNSNFELLRIICIILVICGHITMYNGTLGQIGTINYYIGNIIRSFCMVAVNCFILISGYFGIKFSLKKLIKLECIVVFHTLLLFILAVIFKIHTISFKEDILLLMPVLTKRYWFITIYIALCVISPILNLIVNVITKEQYKKILIISIIMFYILPTFLYTINAPTITGDSGYGIINFINLYFIGRYINLYYKDKGNFKIYISLYIVISVLLFLSNHILTVVFGFYFNTFISYDSIFVLLGALTLFMAFKNINIDSKVINNLAMGCFAAYIIHMNPVTSNYIFNNLLSVKKLTGVIYILALFIMPMIIFLVCFAIEKIRIKLMSNIEEKMVEFIQNIYNRFIIYKSITSSEFEQ